MIAIGTRVRTAPLLDQRDYTTLALRRPNADGEVIKRHDSHGECYSVRHSDGAIGYYDPDELIAVGELTSLSTRYPAIDAEPIRVEHSSLERWSEGSTFRAHCPRCKTGLLLVARHQRTLRIQREDRCISCAQRFIYTDNAIGGEALPLEKNG